MLLRHWTCRPRWEASKWEKRRHHCCGSARLPSSGLSFRNESRHAYDQERHPAGNPLTGALMASLVECVPNFSEGRDLAFVKAICNAIRAVSGVKLMSAEPDRDYNRTVVTFVGEPAGVVEACLSGDEDGGGTDRYGPPQRRTSADRRNRCRSVRPGCPG